MARGKRNDKVSLFASSALLFLLLFRLGATTTTKEEKEERAEQGPNTLSAENWRRGGESSLLLPPAPTNNQIKFAKLPVVVSNKCTSVFPSSLSLSAGSRVGVLFFLIPLSLSGARLWGASSRLCLFVGKCTEGKREKGKRKKIKPGGMGKRGGGGEEGRRTREGRSEGCLRQSCPNKGRGMLNQNSHYFLGGPPPPPFSFSLTSLPLSPFLYAFGRCTPSCNHGREAEEGPGRLRHFS